MDIFRRATVQTTSLGEMLVEAKLITDEQLQAVSKLSRQIGCGIGCTLVGLGLFTSQQLAMLIGFQLNIPFVNVREQPVDPEALELIPESLARDYGVLPLGIVDRAILTAMEDPGDAQAIAALESHTGRRIEPVVGIPEDIHEAIDRNYQACRWG